MSIAPQNNRIVLHLWSKFGDTSLNGSYVIARTSQWLADTRTHRQTYAHTHAGNDNTRRPKLASGKNQYPAASQLLHHLPIGVVAHPDPLIVAQIGTPSHPTADSHGSRPYNLEVGINDDVMTGTQPLTLVPWCRHSGKYLSLVRVCG